MTVDDALRQAMKRLSPYSSSPRLDAEVLLAHTLQMGRASLLAHSVDSMSREQTTAYNALIERRAYGEPVAYLTGHKEFFGLGLLITPDVLVPRPETESVVEACLQALSENEPANLADIGTGSGAILVAVAENRPQIRAYGTDISPAALDVARRNCELYGLRERVTLSVGDLLEPLPERVNVIAANLPYVPPGEATPEVAAWEPNVAVFGGGEDGTALIRRFLAEAPNYLLPGGTVVLETAYSQGVAVSSLAKTAFPTAEVQVLKDLAGYDRIVVVKTP